jgi:hypothetical protein
MKVCNKRFYALKSTFALPTQGFVIVGGFSGWFWVWLPIDWLSVTNERTNLSIPVVETSWK